MVNRKMTVAAGMRLAILENPFFPVYMTMTQLFRGVLCGKCAWESPQPGRRVRLESPGVSKGQIPDFSTIPLS